MIFQICDWNWWLNRMSKTICSKLAQIRFDIHFWIFFGIELLAQAYCKMLHSKKSTHIHFLSKAQEDFTLPRHKKLVFSKGSVQLLHLYMYCLWVSFFLSLAHSTSWSRYRKLPWAKLTFVIENLGTSRKWRVSSARMKQALKQIMYRKSAKYFYGKWTSLRIWVTKFYRSSVVHILDALGEWRISRGEKIGYHQYIYITLALGS